jgi:hypothetical protein
MFNKATLRLIRQKAEKGRQVAKVVALRKQENKLGDLAKR